MLGSSDPHLSPLLLDLSYDNGSLPVVWLRTEPLPKFGTFVVSMGISNVVTMSSEISSYVACQSLHTSTYLVGIETCDQSPRQNNLDFS
jgi:hypothetical protein